MNSWIKKPCTTCGEAVYVLAPTRGGKRYLCSESDVAVCKICFRHLSKFELSVGECDRCADEGGMFALGNG